MDRPDHDTLRLVHDQRDTARVLALARVTDPRLALRGRLFDTAPHDGDGTGRAAWKQIETA
jgi:hypothetical protein